MDHFLCCQSFAPERPSLLVTVVSSNPVSFTAFSSGFFVFQVGVGAFQKPVKLMLLEIFSSSSV